jgi:triacylglycerol esterase/lipase EstA (alpha/beta hydrolase family)
MNIKEVFQKYRIQIVFAITGAIGGFLYWRFVGCTSGTCAIKSVWYWTTLWGTAVGYLAGDFIHDILEKIKLKRKEKES